MPLPVFDTAEAVPEAFRGEYEEREDAATPGVKKWHPKGVEDVTGLKNALEAQKGIARTAKEQREAAERERDELKRTSEARAAGITDEQLQKIRDDEAKARTPILTENETLKSENRKLLLTDKVRAFVDKHIMQDRREDAMELLVGKRIDLSDDKKLIVKDAKGQVTAQTPEEFFTTTLKAEKKWLYPGTGASGSDATGSDATAGIGTIKGRTADQIADDMNKQRLSAPNPLKQAVSRVATPALTV